MKTCTKTYFAILSLISAAGILAMCMDGELTLAELGSCMLLLVFLAIGLQAQR